MGADNVMYIHVTLVPSVGPWDEVKTKPTQHSVHKMREIGIQPDILICRSKVPLGDDVKDKIALFCDVDTSAVIECLDASTIYEVPLLLEEAGLCKMAMKRLCMEQVEPDLTEWQGIVDVIKRPKYRLNIAVVGKYVDNGDAYISIGEALKHAGISRNARVNVGG